jgi:ABC-type uncharacterized transport system fused permease/ATPase subunit
MPFSTFVLALAFRKGKKQKWEESGDVDIYSASAATAKEIKLVGLNVVSDDGAKILENVSLHLKPGTMNGLLGLSGSGEPFFVLNSLHEHFPNPNLTSCTFIVPLIKENRHCLGF